MKTFPRPLTIEEEKDYLERYRKGDMEARNVLIERNLRLVAHVARKYQTSDEETDDLISIGTIGLIKAIQTFDHRKNSRLGTYAAKCIENAILSQMRLWFRISPPRAEKNQNGVFWHRLRRIYTSFAPLRTVM
ncbi:MAG: sigma-70 family RNA polymerase sigma factor [Candidatus Limivivens sp.]|nr:sigma-70 family RNA polymerase sigma factor [Candidatus Limivivens sp.]